MCELNDDLSAAEISPRVHRVVNPRHKPDEQGKGCVYFLLLRSFLHPSQVVFRSSFSMACSKALVPS